MQSASILCYGEIDLDVYLAVSRLPDVNRSAYVTSEFENIGGASANTAIWLANWGVPTRLAGHDLGDDRAGGFVRDELKRFPHLDTEYICYHSDYATPRCQCLVTPDSERTFIMHWLQDLRLSSLTAEMLDGIRWVSLDVSGSLEPRIHAAQLTRSHHIPIVINDIYTEDHPLLPFVDIVILSASIIRTKFPDTDPIDLAHKIQAAGTCDVLVTDGASRVFGLLREHGTVAITPPTIDAIDATGAGDIFKAGLLYGLVNDLPIDEAMRRAVAAGSTMVTRAGTTLDPAPLAELELLLPQIQVKAVT